jgi:hypothetical protein
MRPVRITLTAAGVSAPVPLDQYQTPFNVGLGAAIPAGSSATYTVEHTFDDVFSPTFNPATAVWFPHATMVSKSTSSDGNYAYPVSATRINAAAVTGSLIFNVLQAGAKG